MPSKEISYKSSLFFNFKMIFTVTLKRLRIIYMVHGGLHVASHHFVSIFIFSFVMHFERRVGGTYTLENLLFGSLLISLIFG